MQNVTRIQEVTDTRSGTNHIISNINTLSTISQILSSTLGPFGRDKLFISQNEYLITNDGITILRKLSLDHPVQQLLREISESQEKEIGDGTTSVVLLSIEILENLKELVKEKMPIEKILEAIKFTEKKIYDYLKEESNDIIKSISDENKEEEVNKVIETTLSSKIISCDKKFFSELLAPEICQKRKFLMRKIKGGSFRESFTFKGVAFKKSFSFAGHEQLPKKIKNPKIILLDEEIELRSLRENAQLKVDETKVYKEFVTAEFEILTGNLEKIKNSGASVVLSTKSIGDYATQYFAKNKIFCMGRVSAQDIERISEYSNCIPQVTFNNLVFGECENFEERIIGDSTFYFLESKAEENYPITIFLRGPGDEILNEVERSLDDVILASESALKCSRLVRGGGSFEISMSLFLKEEIKNSPLIFHSVMKKIAQSLEIIPFNLARNFGLDAQEVLKKMRYSHFNKKCCSVSENGKKINESIFEALSLKENIFKAAFSFVKTILNIDSSFVVKN